MRAVLFDAFGTLVRPEPGWEKLRHECLAIVHGSWPGRAMPLPRFLAAYDEVREKQIAEAQRGLREVDFAERFAYAALRCGAPEREAHEWAPSAAERYHRFQQALIHAYDNPVPALRALRGAGYRLAVVSNYAHGGVLREALGRLGILPLLDATVVSGDVGYLKPHPAMFEAALAALGVDASQCVMVGDDPTCDVEGARKAGMRAIWAPFPRDAPAPPGLGADAVVARLAELPPLLATW